jgi:hypothetical protein
MRYEAYVYICDTFQFGYIYIYIELNVCNPYRDNERKVKISIFFKAK